MSVGIFGGTRGTARGDVITTVLWWLASTNLPIRAGPCLRIRHFGVVVGDGSGGLGHELELALRGFGVVVEKFSEGSFARLLHSKFDGRDAVESVFN